MKIKNSLVQTLIQDDDPFPALFAFLVEEIWQPNSSLDAFYAQEKAMTTFENFLVRTYDELFSEVLPKQCAQVQDLFITLPTLYLDSLSLREGVLLKKALEEKGYQVDFSYSFSAIPSETVFYKDKINVRGFKKSNKYREIKNLTNWKIDGDEALIWASFPDALFENLASGKVVLERIESAYRKVEDLTLALIEKIDSDLITIRSDHGYVRHQSIYSFPIEKGIREIRRFLGGGRWDEIGLEDELSEELEQYLVKTNDFVMAKSQYVWPVSGKYKVLQHGGVSLMECLTPVLEIRK